MAEQRYSMLELVDLARYDRGELVQALGDLLIGQSPGFIVDGEDNPDPALQHMAAADDLSIALSQHFPDDTVQTLWDQPLRGMSDILQYTPPSTDPFEQRQLGNIRAHTPFIVPSMVQIASPGRDLEAVRRLAAAPVTEASVLPPDHPHQLLLQGLVDTELTVPIVHSGRLAPSDTLVTSNHYGMAAWRRFVVESPSAYTYQESIIKVKSRSAPRGNYPTVADKDLL